MEASGVIFSAVSDLCRWRVPAEVLSSDWVIKELETQDTHLSFAEFLQMFMPSLKMDIGTCRHSGKPQCIGASSTSCSVSDVLRNLHV